MKITGTVSKALNKGSVFVTDGVSVGQAIILVVY